MSDKEYLNQSGNASDQDVTNSLDAPVSIVPNKLDADQYAADDLDGVTESVFGSGNMSYASLQASQTDAALAGRGDVLDIDDVGRGDLPGDESARGDGPHSEGGARFAPEGKSGGAEAEQRSVDTDRAVGQPEEIGTTGGGGSYSAATVGSVGASTLSSDSGSFASSNTGLNLRETLNGERGRDGEDASSSGTDGNNGSSGSDGSGGNDGNNGNSGNNGNNGNDGNNGQNGNDGGPGDGTTITINEGDINIDTDILNALTEIVQNFYTNIFGGGGDNPEGDIDLDLGLGILDNALLDVADNILIDPIEDLVGDVDLGIGLVTDLLGGGNTDNSAGDSDILTALDLDIVDVDRITGSLNIGIDPVEALIGDIDLNILSATNLFGDLAAPLVNDLPGGTAAGGVLSGVGDVAGTVVADLTGPLLGDTAVDFAGGLDLFGSGETDNDAGDTDLGLQLDGSALGLDAIQIDQDIPLDPVEAIVGDIDLDIIVNGDIINGAGLDIGDVIGSGQVTAAEEVIGEVTDGLSDVVSGVVDGASEVAEDTVPDLVEAITEGAVDDIIDDGLDGALDAAAGLLGADSGSEDSDLDAGADIEVLDIGLVDTAPEIVIDPVEDLAGDLDIDLGLGADIFGDNETDNDAGDSDIALGLDTDLADNDVVADALDINLDPVEQITGDIDIDLGAGLDVLGDAADPLVNDDEGGTEGGGLLADIGDALEDIVAPLDIEPDLHPAEDVSAALEDEIADALDLLVGGGTDETSGDADSSENTNWTESTITDGGGLFGDIAGVAGDAGDVLPDPSGTVAEGLGALDVGQEIDIGGFGGLFG